MKNLTPVVLLAVLAGCASAPPPPAPIRAPYPEAVQNTALVAQHWGAIAADVAAQTKKNQAGKDIFQDRPFFVNSTSTSPFDLAFTNFMITALVEAGLQVTMQPEGALEIRYETQLIRHNLEFDPRNQGYVPGAPTNVGAGFWVLRNANRPLAEGVVSDASQDDPRARLRPSSVEMLITTSIVDGDQYIQRSSDAYYIEKADAELFEVKSVEPVKQRVYREWNVDSK